MNYSDLPVYYSKENLTNRFVDYSNVYLLPSICYIGILTNIVCLLVTFKRDDSNAKTLDFILINSFIDLLFLIIESFLFIIRCGVLCTHGFSYGAKVYEMYMFIFAGYVLVTSQVLLNIFVSYDRLRMFSAKKYNRKQMNIFKIYTICFIISLFANTPPYLGLKEIVPFGIFKPDTNNNSNRTELLYKRVIRKELNTPIYQDFMIAWLVVKDPVLFLVLCGCSIKVCLKYRAHFKTKKLLLRKCSTCKTSFLINLILAFFKLIFIIKKQLKHQ